MVCSSRVNVISSGGGFSKYYDQPSYQKAAVARYFATVKGTTNEPVIGFNASKRAYPDVALAGASYRMYTGGKVYDLYGAAMAATSVAAFFSNINAVRLAAGRGSLGFVTPALYTNPSAFVNDITSGDNKCGRQNSVGAIYCCKQGFTAVAGWDPTTGLGSLDYAKLAAALSGTSIAPSPQPLSLPSARAPTQPTVLSPSWAPTQLPSLSPSRAPMLYSLKPSSLPPMQPYVEPSSQPPVIVIASARSGASRTSFGAYTSLENATI